MDSRHSGRDLVPNHLTFFVMNHVAVFPESNWPRQMVVNGSVLMDGKKMSKSMGNIIPLRKAVREYGADPIRIAILVSAELLQDADFSLESVGSIRGKLEAVLRECSRLRPGPVGTAEAEDRWIASRLQGLVASASSSIEKMRLREALHEILFAFEDDIQWYLKRASAKGRGDCSAMLHKIHSTRVAMLSPFAPHIAEEMWQGLGNPGMVSRSAWPEADAGAVDAGAVQAEHLLKSVIGDIANILKVTKIAPAKITVYTAGSLKSRAYRAVLERVVSGQTHMGAIMRDLIADPETSGIKSNPDFVQKAIRDILSEPTEIRNARLETGDFDERGFVSRELASVAGREFGVPVSVLAEDDPGVYDPRGKARHARPFKPAILIE